MLWLRGFLGTRVHPGALGARLQRPSGRSSRVPRALKDNAGPHALASPGPIRMSYVQHGACVMSRFRCCVVSVLGIMFVLVYLCGPSQLLMCCSAACSKEGRCAIGADRGAAEQATEIDLLFVTRRCKSSGVLALRATPAPQLELVWPSWL